MRNCGYSAPTAAPSGDFVGHERVPQCGGYAGSQTPTFRKWRRRRADGVRPSAAQFSRNLDAAGKMRDEHDRVVISHHARGPHRGGSGDATSY